MQSTQQPDPLAGESPNGELAEVIMFPTETIPPDDIESFYQRRAGNLPRLHTEGSVAVSRGTLPSPVAPEPENPLTKLREIMRVNRPSWLPQR